MNTQDMNILSTARTDFHSHFLFSAEIVNCGNQRVKRSSNGLRIIKIIAAAAIFQLSLALHDPKENAFIMR